LPTLVMKKLIVFAVCAWTATTPAAHTMAPAKSKELPSFMKYLPEFLRGASPRSNMA
jgi:hypothetical protein